MESERTRARGSALLPVVAAVAVGVAVGLGVFTIGYADGTSYLGNDPAACANCHVMQGHFDAWLKSSHKDVATCNDCHASHDFAAKYLTKAINGFNHSIAFTTGSYPEIIRINEFNRMVTEGTCRSCHAELTHSIDLGVSVGHDPDPIECMGCHQNVGHLR